MADAHSPLRGCLLDAYRNTALNGLLQLPVADPAVGVTGISCRIQALGDPFVAFKAACAAARRATGTRNGEQET